MVLFRSIKAFMLSLVSLSIFGFKIAVGLLAFAGAARFLDSAVWDDLLARGLQELSVVNNLEPAVNVVGAVFVITWFLRFWDQALPKRAVTPRWGILSKGPLRLSRFFTAPLVHGDYTHLRSNTRDLLLFMGIAILVMPTVSGFVLISLVLIAIHGLGVWRMGAPVPNLGASGMVLGYFSFDVFYNFFITRSWPGVIIAVLMILWRGRPMYRTLMNRSKGISVAGHVWGFIGGIIAAAIVPYLHL